MTAPFAGPEGPKIRIGSLYGQPGASFYEPDKEANGALIITGGTGVGKTRGLEDISAQLFTCGCSLIMIDFHGGIKAPYQETVSLTEGPKSEMALRPLQITPYVIGKYGLDGAASQILSTVESSGRKLGDGQKKILRKSITSLWERHGIDEADDDTWEERDIPTGEWIDVLSDMQDEAENAAERNAIKSALDRVDHLANSSVFNGRYSVGPSEIMDTSKRFDLSGLTGETRIIAAEIILRSIWWEAMARSESDSFGGNPSLKRKKYIVIDEAKILTKAHAKKDESERLVNIIATETRKFGLGLIAASQLSAHFDSEVWVGASCRLIFQPFDGQEAYRISKATNIPSDTIKGIPGKDAAVFNRGGEGAFELVITTEWNGERGFADSL